MANKIVDLFSGLFFFFFFFLTRQNFYFNLIKMYMCVKFIFENLNPDSCFHTLQVLIFMKLPPHNGCVVVVSSMDLN